VKGWDLTGEPVDLQPWQELAVLALLGWDDGERTVTLSTRAPGEEKSVVLLTAGRYVSARTTGNPLRDDPARNRGQQEEDE
jgi:hypothetical protein